MGSFSKIWIIIGFFILFSYSLQALNINSFEVYSNIEETNLDDNNVFFGVLEKDSNIYMQLNISGLEEEPNLEQIYFNSNLFSSVIYPTNCNNISNDYICFATSQVENSESNIYNIRAIIKDQSGAVITTKDAKICNNYYDVLISFNNLAYDSENKKLSGKINLTKIIKEDDCPKVNLSGLELYFDEIRVKTFQTKDFVNDVVNFNLDVTNDVSKIKTNTIFMDMYSFEEEKSLSEIDSSLVIDTTKPEIKNLRLVDENGNDVNLLSKKPGQAINLGFLFEIDDPNFETITFDFSEMVMEQFLKSQVNNIPIDADNDQHCSKNDDTYSCQTPAIPTNEPEFTIDYYIEDKYDNFNTGSKSFQLTLDSQGPEVEFYSSKIELSEDITGQSRDEENSDDLDLLFSGNTIPSNFQLNSVSNCIEEDATCYFRNNAYLEYILKISDDNLVEKNKTIFDVGNLYNNPIVRPNIFNKTTINSALAGVNFKISSSSNSGTTVKLDHRSKDSAGNSYINNIVMNFVYDNTYPENTSLNISRNGADTYSKNIIATNDKIDLSFRVNETTSPKVYATVDFNEFTLSEDIQTKECTKINTTLFECNFTSRNVKPGPFKGEAHIYVYDLAGNVKKITKEINITGKMDAQTPEVVFGTPTFTPSKIYRNLASMIGYPIRGTLPLDMESNLLIDRQFIRSCDSDYLEGDLLNWYEIHSDSGATSSTLSFKLNPLTSTFLENNNYLNFSCEIATYIRTQDYIYPRADIQTLDFSFELDETTLMTPGEEVIKEIEDDYNNTIVKYGKWLHSAGNIIDLGVYACKTKDALVGASTSLTISNGILTGVELTLEVLTTVLGPFIKPAEKVVEGVGKILGKIDNFVKKIKDGLLFKIGEMSIFEGISNSDATKKTKGIIQTMCEFVTCSNCDATQATEQINSWWDVSQNGSLSGIVDNQYSLGQDVTLDNPTDTFIGSMSCMCVPGMIKKIQEYRELVCAKDVCLYTQASAGGSLMECKKTFVEGQCTLFVGEFYTLIPFGRAFDDWVNLFAGSLEMPQDFIQNLLGGLICPSNVAEGDWSNFKLSEAGQFINIQWLLGNRDIEKLSGFDSFPKFINYALCDLPKAVAMGKEAADSFVNGFNEIKDLVDDFSIDKLMSIVSISSGEYDIANEIIDKTWWPEDPCNQLDTIINETAS